MIVSKIEAAVAQIKTAVELYFSNGDPIAIHVLTMSSNDVMRSMMKHVHDISMMREFEFLATKDARKQARDAVNEAYNAFKHSDKDPDPRGLILLNPKATEILLFESCYYVEKLQPVPILLLKLYIAWFATWNEVAANTYKDYPEFGKFNEIRSQFNQDQKVAFYTSHKSSLSQILIRHEGPAFCDLIDILLN